MVGGATAYLRRIGESGGGSCRIDISSAASGSYTGAGPELIPEWENLVNAIVFSADGGGITSSSRDRTTLTIVSGTRPSRTSGLRTIAADYRDWIVAEPRNVTVRFNGPVIPDPSLDVAVSLDGGLSGAIDAAVSLGQAPPLSTTASLDGGLSGSISATADLGHEPTIDTSAALTGGLSGSISAVPNLGPLSTVDTSIALTGGLAGSIAATASLDTPPPFPLRRHRAHDGLARALRGAGHHQRDRGPVREVAPRCVRDPRGWRGGDWRQRCQHHPHPKGREPQRPDSVQRQRQLQLERHVWRRWVSDQPAVLRPDIRNGLAVVPLDGNVASAAGNNFLLDIPTADQAIIASIVGGARFIMGFGAPTKPRSTRASPLTAASRGPSKERQVLGPEPAPSDATLDD